MAAPGLFLKGSIRKINYKKYKTNKNLNISISQKKKKNLTNKQNKTKIEIHKILQLHSMISLLLILRAIFISMYTTKQTFIH